MNKYFLWGVIAVIVIGALSVFTSYNGIVALDQGTQSKWSAVEGQYQRRMDLIPNLVATVTITATTPQRKYLFMVKDLAYMRSI